MNPPGTVDQPHGTVSFLFSDIEGSTRLLQTLGSERYADALARHRRLLRQAFADHGGYEVDCEGDQFFVAFRSADEAVAAAAEAQHALAGHPWPDGTDLRVRMGIHTGEPLLAPPKYVGLDVHKAARLMAAAHGGQVLISQATLELCDGELANALILRDLGEHRLKDLTEPERVHQLIVAGLRQDFPPLRTLTAARLDLPAEPNRFVGRARELAEVCADLERVHLRLLTLTGPGGSGKTRLALQAAARRAGAYRDGVRFVALAAVADPQLLATTIAQTLGLVEKPGVASDEVLRLYLAERELLLVLDNLEHLRAGAGLLGKLLGSSPSLQLLATSREPLRLAAEHEYPVPPLDEHEAIELFHERARAVRRDFTADGEVAQICRRLDALPLAVELAAARVRSLSAAEILARLDTRLPLLTDGPRDAPDRQRTLRATIDWSYSLAAPPEQRLFSDVSVFSGGFSLQAAGDVCDAGLGDLEALVDHSLLQRSGTNTEPRFTMLETIREYALERLEDSAEAEDVRRRHARYFLELAERGDLWEYPQQLETDLLQREQDNFRTALTWFRTTGEEESELQLVAALGWFWGKGHLQEGRKWLDEAVPRAERHELPLRVRLLTVAAGVLGRQGDSAEAASLQERCLALHREAGDSKRAALSLMHLGALATQEGQFARAKDLLDEGRRLCEEVGDWRTFAGIGINLGNLAQSTGDLEDAKELYGESLGLFEELQQDYGRRIALLNLGHVALEQNRLDEAETLVEESLRVVALRTWSPEPLELLAAVAARRGDSARAVRLLGAAAAAREQTGAALPPAEQHLHERTALEARARLGDRRFEELQAEVAAMTPEQAVDFALAT